MVYHVVHYLVGCSMEIENCIWSDTAIAQEPSYLFAFSSYFMCICPNVVASHRNPTLVCYFVELMGK